MLLTLPPLQAVEIYTLPSYASLAHSMVVLNQEEIQVTLKCDQPSISALKPRPSVALKGTCSCPNGVPLKIKMTGYVEDLLPSGALVPIAKELLSRIEEVETEKYSCMSPIAGPGNHTAEVTILDKFLDQRELPDDVKRALQLKNRWKFDFLLWDRNLVGTLGSQLSDVRSLTEETQEYVRKVETAIGSEQSWTANREKIISRGQALRSKLESHELTAFFSAALGNLSDIMRMIVGSAPKFVFENGKFKGVGRSHNQKLLNDQDVEFSWEELNRAVGESIQIAGREYWLWMIKDVRHAGGKIRPEVIEAIDANSTIPTSGDWGKRLKKASSADLDIIETEIRAASRKDERK